MLIGRTVHYLWILHAFTTVSYSAVTAYKLSFRKRNTNNNRHYSLVGDRRVYERRKRDIRDGLIAVVFWNDSVTVGVPLPPTIATGSVSLEDIVPEPTPDLSVEEPPDEDSEGEEEDEDEDEEEDPEEVDPEDEDDEEDSPTEEEEPNPDPITTTTTELDPPPLPGNTSLPPEDDEPASSPDLPPAAETSPPTTTTVAVDLPPGSVTGVDEPPPPPTDDPPLPGNSSQPPPNTDGPSVTLPGDPPVEDPGTTDTMVDPPPPQETTPVEEPTDPPPPVETSTRIGGSVTGVDEPPPPPPTTQAPVETTIPPRPEPGNSSLEPPPPASTITNRPEPGNSSLEPPPPETTSERPMPGNGGTPPPEPTSTTTRIPGSVTGVDEPPPPPPTTTPAPQCEPGFFFCGAESRGCCPTGWTCGESDCIPPPQVSVTDSRVCGPNSFLCPEDLGYGCCENGQICGATICMGGTTPVNPITERSISTSGSKIIVSGSVTDALVITYTKRNGVVAVATLTDADDIQTVEAEITSYVTKAGDHKVGGGKAQPTYYPPGWNETYGEEIQQQGSLSGVSIGGIVAGSIIGVLALAVGVWITIRRLKGRSNNEFSLFAGARNRSQTLFDFFGGSGRSEKHDSTHGPQAYLSAAATSPRPESTVSDALYPSMSEKYSYGSATNRYSTVKSPRSLQINTAIASSSTTGTRTHTAANSLTISTTSPTFSPTSATGGYSSNINTNNNNDTNPDPFASPPQSPRSLASWSQASSRYSYFTDEDGSGLTPTPALRTTTTHHHHHDTTSPPVVPPISALRRTESHNTTGNPGGRIGSRRVSFANSLGGGARERDPFRDSVGTEGSRLSAGSWSSAETADAALSGFAGRGSPSLR